jgi:hypothetical protein
MTSQRLVFVKQPFLKRIADNVKHYFDCVKDHLPTVLSMFVWNADEARVGASKTQQVPVVTVSASTSLGLITVPDSRDDCHLIHLTDISTFTHSIP